MTRRRRDVGERPTCPEHPGSAIQIDRRERASVSGYFEGLSYRCVYPGGRHRLSRDFLPRTMTEHHPSAGLPCPHCGQVHAVSSGGQIVARGYTFTTLEIARALFLLGQGLSYTKTAKSIRTSAFRVRGAPRTGRAMAPRGMGRSNGRTTRSSDYDYRSPREPGSLSGPFSQSATTVACWLDAFGPAILEAFAPSAMPVAIAVDSLPITRRAWTIDPDTGDASKRFGGNDNGELMAVADRTQSPTFPILTSLEGTRDAEAWRRTFAKLPAGSPRWVVADIDSAIAIAVAAAWPDAILFRCEEHLRERMRKALRLDGFTDKISVEAAEALGAKKRDRKRPLRRGSVELVDHPLFSLVGRSLMSRDTWAELCAAAEALPRGCTSLRGWIEDNTELVLRQFDLKEANPTMPRSTGGLESATFGYISNALGERTEYFSNARRLELLCGLMRIASTGLASEERYAQIVMRTLSERSHAGFDFPSYRDQYGTSSIDDLIEWSFAQNAIAIERRNADKRTANRERAIAAVEAERAAAGLPPAITGRERREDGGHTYYRIVKGQTVADIPELAEHWDPARNGGRLASDVQSGSTYLATWVCREHEADGHLHTWPRRVCDRATSRSGCPVRMQRDACPTTSLAFLFPDMIANEWDFEANTSLDPTRLRPGSNLDATWICPVHGRYPQRIAARTKQAAGCEKCGRERRLEATRGTDAQRSRRSRAAAAEDRGPLTPPVVDTPVGDGSSHAARRARRQRSIASESREVTKPPVVESIPYDPSEEWLNAHAVAAELGRSRQTIVNWIKAGRIRGHRDSREGVRTTIPFRVPRSEVERVRSILRDTRDGDAPSRSRRL